jgi:predicted metal-dependent hydrolase
VSLDASDATDYELETRFGIVPVRIRRNPRRKTRMGFAFEATGGVVVDAPLSAPLLDIHAALHEHARWIGYRSNQARSNLEAWVSPRFEAGELHYYLGERYVLRIGAERTGLEDGELWLPGTTTTTDQARALLETWYTERANVVLGEIVHRCVAQLSWVVDIPPWQHQFMRSQWGSCSAKGRLSLNTHLIKVPEPLIEYVVMHELCHLKHLNHSRRFYGLLSKQVGDWEVKRRALARYTGFLTD